MIDERSILEERARAARYYADRRQKRFFVYGLSEHDLREWQVREGHEWIGIAGGSGLIESFAFEDKSLAVEEARRLNALDAEALKESHR